MLELSAIPAEAALSSKMMAYKLPSPQPMNWVSLFESKSEAQFVNANWKNKILI